MKTFRQKVWDANGDQKIDTGNPDFDAQTSMIGRGNQVGGTVHSGYVRPHHETKSSGSASPTSRR